MPYRFGVWTPMAHPTDALNKKLQRTVPIIRCRHGGLEGKEAQFVCAIWEKGFVMTRFELDLAQDCNCQVAGNRCMGIN